MKNRNLRCARKFIIVSFCCASYVSSATTKLPLKYFRNGFVYARMRSEYSTEQREQAMCNVHHVCMCVALSVYSRLDRKQSRGKSGKSNFDIHCRLTMHVNFIKRIHSIPADIAIASHGSSRMDLIGNSLADFQATKDRHGPDLADKSALYCTSNRSMLIRNLQQSCGANIAY